MEGWRKQNTFGDPFVRDERQQKVIGNALLTKKHLQVRLLLPPLMKIVESVTSIWFYHLSDDGKNPLCGSTQVMMPTQVPLDTWGLKTHLNEKYCAECYKRFTSLQRKVGS